MLEIEDRVRKIPFLVIRMLMVHLYEIPPHVDNAFYTHTYIFLKNQCIKLTRKEEKHKGYTSISLKFS